jgi:hypothetical protein
MVVDNIADILVQMLKERIRAYVSLHQLPDSVLSGSRGSEPLLACMLFCASPFRRSVACQRGTDDFKISLGRSQCRSGGGGVRDGLSGVCRI